MATTSEHLAVIFDFDDTLVPDSTSLFLESKGFDVEDFWGREARALVERGFDAPLVYLQLMLDEVKEGGRLEGLTNAELRAFGATLDDKFYEGLPGLFEDLQQVVSETRDITLEFFIISSGIQDLIEGSQIVQDHFEAVYACRLEEDADAGQVRYMQRVVTFTEKTRYLFEINKGISPEESAKNAGLVNEKVITRRIPFENMIYVGDGMTDIPCFSLVKNEGGRAFGVFDPTKPHKAKMALEKFLSAGRTSGAYIPRYGRDNDLGVLLRTAVLSRCTDIDLRRKESD